MNTARPAIVHSPPGVPSTVNSVTRSRVDSVISTCGCRSILKIWPGQRSIVFVSKATARCPTRSPNSIRSDRAFPAITIASIRFSPSSSNPNCATRRATTVATPRPHVSRERSYPSSARA